MSGHWGRMGEGIGDLFGWWHQSWLVLQGYPSSLVKPDCHGLPWSPASSFTGSHWVWPSTCAVHSILGGQTGCSREDLGRIEKWSRAPSKWRVLAPPGIPGSWWYFTILTCAKQLSVRAFPSLFYTMEQINFTSIAYRANVHIVSYPSISVIKSQ